MTERQFLYAVGAVGIAFTLAFSFTVAPLLLQTFDILGAITAGFVNPYSTGFALDTLSSWLVLTIWIAYEAKTLNVRYGWVAVLLGLIPGTVTGLAFYLVLRTVQLKQAGRAKA